MSSNMFVPTADATARGEWCADCVCAFVCPGESVADTSTSSPDMAGPVSPCPKVASESVRSSPSPAHRDRSVDLYDYISVMT